KVPHDYSRIEIEMNASTPEQDTLTAVLKLEEMIKAVEEDIVEEFGQPMVDSFFVSLQSRTRAEVQAKLVDPELRPMSTFDLSARWREVMPEITGLKSLTIFDNIFGGG